MNSERRISPLVRMMRSGSGTSGAAKLSESRPGNRRARCPVQLEAQHQVSTATYGAQSPRVSHDDLRVEGDAELCVHYLRIALESVLDVCRHFLAAVGVGLSDLEAANLIELAGEKGLLERTFASRIRGMAGLRNAIVHVYWRLDYHAIHRAVTEQVSDFDEFARQVRVYLEQDGRK